jgi:hypothetical protein
MSSTTVWIVVAAAAVAALVVTVVVLFVGRRRRPEAVHVDIARILEPFPDGQSPPSDASSDEPSSLPEPPEDPDSSSER